MTSPIYSSGTDDGNLHNGLEQRSIRFAAGIFECHRTGNLKCHFRGVDFMVGTVEQGDLYVHHREACQHTGLHGTLNTCINSGDIFLRDGAADDWH